MKEFQEIIKAYNKCIEEGKKTALAAVVHLDGSSYRRPGARMLINELAAGTSPPKLSRKEKNYVELNNLSLEVGNIADMPDSTIKREEIGSAYAYSFSSLSHKRFLGLG